MSTSDNLLFPIADALQVELLADAKAALGKFNRKVNLGPWQLTISGEVKSLSLTPESAQVIAHIRKDLHLLLVTTQHGHTVRAIMFDGAKAGVKKGTIPGSLADAHQKIKLAAVKYLKFDNANYRWSGVDAFNLD